MANRSTARKRATNGRRVVRPTTATTGRIRTGLPPSPLVGPLTPPIPPVTPPPDPDPGTTIPNYSPYNSDVFTHTDGYRVARSSANPTDTFFSVVSQADVLPDTILQRRYVGTARVKAGAQGTGKNIIIGIRERTASGTLIDEKYTQITLTGSFQTFSVTKDAVAAGNEVDLRVSFQGAVSGDEFILDDPPSFTVEDGVGTPPDPPPPSSGTAFDYPYWPGSLWRQPITALALDSNSSGIASLIQSGINGGTKISVGITGETPTRYECSPSYNNYTVTISGYSGTWRVPPNATTGGGSDKPIILYDPNHPTHGEYTALRIWQANINHTARTITGSNYGLFKYNNDGRKLASNMHSVGRSIENSPARGAGNGLSYDAGQVLRAEVEALIAGEIETLGHAIRLACPTSWVRSTWRPPATKSDQSSSNAHQMGQRWRLPASLDPDTRTVPTTSASTKKPASANETKLLRGLVRTAKKEGLMTCDGSGGWVMYFEADASAQWSDLLPEKYLDSYSWIIRDNRMNDIYARNANDGIPWSLFEFVASVPDVV